MNKNFELDIFKKNDIGQSIEAEYKEIVDRFFLIVKTDLNENIVYINNMVVQYVGLPREDIICENIYDIFEKEGEYLKLNDFYFSITKDIIKDNNGIEIEFMFILKDETRLVLLKKENESNKDKFEYFNDMVNILDKNKHKKGTKEYIEIKNTDLLRIFENMENLKIGLIEEKRKRRTCPLTGLLNKSAYMEDNKYFYDKGIAILDLDHFKSVNDTFGHNVGDIVLKEISGVIAKSLRREDKAYRFGGEEFIIISDKESIKNISERIRKNIENKYIEIVGYKTVSIGVSYIDNDLDKAFEKADKALYTAKENGRNQVQELI